MVVDGVVLYLLLTICPRFINQRRNFESIKENKISWDQLLTGFKKKNTLLDYYSEDVLCLIKENYREKI